MYIFPLSFNITCMALTYDICAVIRSHYVVLYVYTTLSLATPVRRVNNFQDFGYY